MSPILLLPKSTNTNSPDERRTTIAQLGSPCDLFLIQKQLQEKDKKFGEINAPVQRQERQGPKNIRPCRTTRLDKFETNHSQHLTRGVTQYEYIQSLTNLLDGQAARLLEDLVDVWDYHNYDNSRFNRATRCEAKRDVWRQYYNDYDIYTMLRTNRLDPGSWPEALDMWEEHVYEPPKLEEFLALLETTFKASQA